LKKPTTVTGLTSATSGSIEIAPSSGPNAGPCCASVHINGPRLTWVELSTTTRHGCSPDCVWAIIAAWDKAIKRVIKRKKKMEMCLERLMILGSEIFNAIRASPTLLFILFPHVDNSSHVDSHFYNFTPTLLFILSSFLLK
jgi:hypothetical protein